MEVQIATLCDAAADYSGKLSILGAFDTIGGPEFPVFHNQCALALRLCFQEQEAGEHKISIRFLDADGGPLTDPIEPVIPVQMPAGNPGFITRNLVLNMHRLKFDKAGQYKIDISNGTELLASVPLRVLHLQAPGGAAPQGDPGAIPEPDAPAT